MWVYFVIIGARARARETALQRKDEEEFAKGTGRRPQNEEGFWARYESALVICPFCGSELIDGKCASCG